jgi:hypothetical protein
MEVKIDTSKQLEKQVPMLSRGQWVSALAAWCASLWVYGYFYLATTSHNLSYLLGAVAVQCFAAWAVFQLSVNRRAGPAKAVTAFLVISLVFIGAVVSRHFQRVRNNKVILQELETLISPPQGERDADSRISHPPAAKTIDNAGGDEGRMVRFAREQAAKGEEAMELYRSELESAGMLSLLDASRISNDEQLTDSFLVLGKAKVVMQRHKALAVKRMDASRQALATLDIGEESKTAALMAFDANRKEAIADGEAFWGLEFRVVAEYEKLLNLLDSSQGNWKIEGGQVIFADDADAIAFNRHLSAVQSIFAEQESLQAAIRDRQIKKLRAVSP